MIKYHKDIEQGSDEWRALRCGKLTASEMKLVLTPTLKIADNDKSRQHVYDIAAQRVSRFVEPSYEGWDMQRGKEDELEAAILYNSRYAGLERCGFVENDEWGFTICCSPDALVGDNGFIETKSRNQTLQFKTIVECLSRGKVPDEHMLQVQTSFLVMAGRKWCDYNSYSGGLYMATIRVEPDLEIQRAIIEAARDFEKKVQEKIGIFEKFIGAKETRLLKTERRKPEEITPS